jgi:5-methylcytosine-specific restriction protein A
MTENQDDFEVGTEYVRKELHDKYGGNRQSGISPLLKHPMVLLFTGDTKDLYGYHDGWTNSGDFLYSGEGKSGDMVFKRGNKAIRDHQQNDIELHLFEKTSKGRVKYVGRMRYVSHEIRESTPDFERRGRSAIVFRLTPDV